MSDYRDQLERERRKYAMRDGTLEGLRRRQDRKRRNGQILAAVVALLIAAAGIGGGLFALRGAEKQLPGHSPKPSPSAVPRSVPIFQSRPSGPLQFLDAEHGWMVDGDGQILATTDGGGTWHVQLSGPSNITAIQFVDEQHGWGLGQGGLIETSDGGAHWGTWSNQSLSSFQFISPKLGWGVAEAEGRDGPGPIMRSEDGGVTWSRSGPEVYSLCFSGAVSGWAAAPAKSGVALLKTNDLGDNWTDASHINLPEGEPWSASLQCVGKEVWAQVKDGGAAGHNPYGVFQSIDGGAARLVMQEGGTRPFGHQEGVYESEDPYPGPFTVVMPGVAHFLNWCPPCGGGPQASVSITTTGGDPAAVTGRFPVLAGDSQGEPVGVSFPVHIGSKEAPLGWALLNVNGPKGPTQSIFKTTDGGRTWAEVSRPGS